MFNLCCPYADIPIILGQMDKKNVKKPHNFYVPDFIAEILEKEESRFGGKGNMTSAAILALSRMTDAQKRAALEAFRKAEIDSAFK